MTVELHEAVRVGAIFSHGNLRPVWFDLQGRQIWVREVAFTWKTREGRDSVLHYSVTDGCGLYELCLNTEKMSWIMVRAEDCP